MTANEQIGITGYKHNASNLGLTGCYNICGVKHPFNPEKREDCRKVCDRQFATGPSDQQQEMLEQLINQETGSGISTGVILAIVGGIIVLTIGGVILIKKLGK